MAQVPITKQRGEVEVWQAAYDNSVPIDLHGGVIDSLTYSLSNQDGEPVNLQGSDFNATLRIMWADPVPPAIEEMFTRMYTHFQSVLVFGCVG